MKLTKTESEFLEHMKSLRKNDWYLYLAIMCMMNATIKDRGDNSPIGRDVSAASNGDLKRAIKRLRQSASPVISPYIEMTAQYIRMELLHKEGPTHETDRSAQED